MMKRVRGDEEGENDEAQELDEAAVKKMLLQLERCVSRNMEARSAHARDPSKWIESEMELDEAVTGVTAISADPRLYAVVVQQRAHETLLGLLVHDNADVATSVLTLLTELLDDAPEEAEEAMAQALAGELAEAGALSAALANWKRLEPGKDGAAVEATAAFLERLHARDGEVAEALAAAPGFLALVARTYRDAAATEETRLAVSELLSTAVLSAGPVAADTAALDALLGTLNTLGRASKGAGLAQSEILSNTAGAVANLVLRPDWAEAFATLQGVQLAAKLLQKGGAGVLAAMRLLSCATQENAAACETLVEAGGLGELFWWWKQPGWPRKAAKRFGWGQDDWQTMGEALVSTVHNCCALLAHDSMPQLRLWKKFADNKGEAVSRAGQLWSEYRAGLARKGLMATAPQPDGNVAGGEEGDEEERELLLRRLDGGWLQLTQLTLVLVWLAVVPTPLQQELASEVAAAAAMYDLQWVQVAALLQENRRRTGYDLSSVNVQLEKLFQH
jgi:beta-catenin-like protein 1